MSNPAKEYLQQVHRLEKEIEIKSRGIKEIDCKLQKCTFELTGDIKEDNPYKDKVEKLMDKKTELKNLIADNVSKMLSKRLEIVNEINSLEKSEHRILLELRYLQFKRWDEIATYMCYSDKHIYWVHGQALREFENIVLNRTKKCEIM